MRKLRIKYASTHCKKLPYLLVVGDKERESNTVAVRARGRSGSRCNAFRRIRCPTPAGYIPEGRTGAELSSGDDGFYCF